MKTQNENLTIRRFSNIPSGTKFTIFAEPSRGMRWTRDKTTYTKFSDAYSTAPAGGRDIILYPEDLVAVVSYPPTSSRAAPKSRKPQ